MVSVLTWLLKQIEVWYFLYPLLRLRLLIFFLFIIVSGFTTLVLPYRLLYMRRYHHLILIHDKLLTRLFHPGRGNSNLLIVYQGWFLANVSFCYWWDVLGSIGCWSFQDSLGVRIVPTCDAWYIMNVLDGGSDYLRWSSFRFVEVLLRTIACEVFHCLFVRSLRNLLLLRIVGSDDVDLSVA